MKNLLYLLCFIAALSYSACGCPSDEQIGELSLESDTRKFLPYTGNETLEFTNDAGVAVSFEAPRGMEINSDRLCTRTTCVEAKFGSPSSCEYYAAESRRFSYFSDGESAVIDLLLFSDVYEYNTTDFYDALSVSFSAGTPSISGGHVVAQRFTGDFDEAQTSVSTLMETVASIELNGQAFSDVLVLEEGDLAIYVQKEVGVIAIRMNGEVWLAV